MAEILGALSGAVLLMTAFYKIFRAVFRRFIPDEKLNILVSSVLSGVVGEIVWYLIHGSISLNYLLAAFIVYLVVLIIYNSKFRKQINIDRTSGE